MRGSGSESGLVKSISRHGVCSAWLRAVAVVALCLAGLLCASPAAQATDYYWDNGVDPNDGKITGGGGVGVTWGTGNIKWTTNGGVTNVKWGNTLSDTAVFTDIGGTIGVNEVNAGGITFNNPSTTGYTLTPISTLHLGAGGVIQTLTTDGNSLGATINTITTKLQLMGTGATTATFSSNSNYSTMQIGNDVKDWMTLGAGVTSATLTLDGTNTGVNRFGYTGGSKNIIDNRAIAVVKDGPGTWWLSGNLNFTSGLTIKEGTLVFSQTNTSLGTTSITLGNSAGGNKDATLISGDSRSISRPITLASTTTGILTVGMRTGSNSTTYSGGVTGNNNLTLASNGNTLLTMSTAAINNVGTLTVNGACNTNISSVIGSQVTSLTKNDAGTLTLSNTNAYTGATLVSGGKLQLDGAAAAGTLSTSALTVGAAGTLGFTVGTMDILNLAGKPFTLGGSLGGGTVAFDIGTTTNDALTVGNFTLDANSFFTVNAVTPLALDAPYTLLTSAGAITNTGPYIITVPGAGGKLAYAITIGANDVKFTASLAEGEWNQAGGGNWSFGDPGATGGNWTNYKPTIAGDAALFGSAIAGPATITVDTPHAIGFLRFDNGANAVTIGSGASSNLTLDNGASAAAITVTSGSHFIAENVALASSVTVSPASGTTLTVSGNLTGGFGVEKKDAGELVLSGTNNSYIGATTVSAGTLSLNGSLTGGGAIAVNGSAVLSESSTGVISGATSITHSSTGTSILSGANTYNGNTTVSAGLLKLDNANAIPGGVGATGGTSKLVFNGGVIGLTSNFNRKIGADANQVLFNSNGGGFAAFGADRTVDFGSLGRDGQPWTKWGTSDDRLKGTLYLSHSTATHTVTVANSFDLGVGGGGTFSVADGAADVDAVLSGYLHRGPFTKTGPGTLVLTGAYWAYVTNAMNTTINEGTLSIGGAGWLAYTNNSGTVNIATGATLNHNSSANQTLSGIISGGGVVTKTGGAGPLILSNANTYTGKTTVTGGTLSFNSIQDAGSATANALGRPAVGADSIIDLGNTGRLKYTGTGHSSDRVINLASLTGGAMMLDATGASGTLALTGGVTSSGTSGTSTLTLTGAGLGSESGAIANGTGTNVTAVTKSGTGTWTLSGTNTYTGATTVSAGTLSLTGSLTATAISTSGTGILNESAAGVIGGAASITQNSSGTSTLAGANTYTGTTTVSGGKLTVSGGGTLAGTTGLSVAGGATFSYLPTTIGTALTLGAGSTLTLSDGSTLGLAWDTATANKVAALGAANVGTGTGVALNMAGTYTSDTAYTILTAASGLGTGNYTFLNPTNYTAVVTKADTSVIITPTTAATLTTAFWNGGLPGATNVWAASDGTTSNWFTSAEGGTTFVVPGVDADVTISATSPTVAPTATRLGADMAIKTLTIADTTTGLGLNADGYMLTITPGASTDGIVMNASVPVSTIAANVALGADQTWTNNSVNTLTVSGNVSGAFALTKAGIGTLTLTGANTYSGDTTVNTGTLQLGNGAVNGAVTSGLYQLDGGTTTLYLNNATAVGAALGGITTLVRGDGTLRLNSQQPLDGSANWGSGVTAPFNVAFTGTLQLDKGRFESDAAGLGGMTRIVVNSGGQFMTVSTDQTYTQDFALAGSGHGEPSFSGALRAAGGATSIFSGNITLTDNAVINSQSSTSTMTINGNISGSGFGISKVGDGLLTLTGTNDYTGLTNITAGTLKLGSAGALPIGDVTVDGTLDLNGNSPTIKAFNGAGTGAITNTNSGSASTLTVGNGDATGNFSGKIQDGSGTVALTKVGTAYITLWGNNTYSGVTTINAGGLCANSPIPNPNTSFVVNTGGQLYGGWAVQGATFANNLTISGLGFSEGGILVGAVRASNNQTFSGTITLADASRISMIEGPTAASTFSGKITGSFALDVQGAFGSDANTQTFTLANTGPASDYTGNISISAVDYGPARTGVTTILKLGAGDQIPNGTGKGNLVFNGADADHITILELNGFSETINGVSNTAAAGAIIRNTADGASTLTIGDAGATSEFSGVITDGGSEKTLAITKIGGGKLTLSGANAYTGDTKVEAGTLSITSAYLANAADVYLTTGAVFDLDFTVGSPNVIDGLFVDNVAKASGTWGSIGSGATHESIFFTGDGLLSVTTSSTLLGDADRNGVVDAADYIVVKQNFGMTTGATWEMGNFVGVDDNGTVDWDDLQVLMANFATRSVPGAPAIPEPGSVMLLMFGAAALLRRRRRKA